MVSERPANPLTEDQERHWRAALEADRWGSAPRWSSQSVASLVATMDRDLLAARLERDKLRLVIANAIDHIAHNRQGHAIRALRAARSLFE